MTDISYYAADCEEDRENVERYMQKCFPNLDCLLRQGDDIITFEILAETLKQNDLNLNDNSLAAYTARLKEIYGN